MRELFIYYRIRAEHAVAARTAALAFQATLRDRHAGLATQLYQRSDEAAGQHTWMETYALRGSATERGVSEDLQNEIEAEAACMTPFLIGPRHTEVFSPCVS